MNKIEQVKSLFNKDTTLSKLIRVLLILLIVLLGSLTWNVWSTIFGYATTALKPFIIGFVLAYILNPLIMFLESKNIKRGLAVGLVMLLTVVGIWFLLISLTPMLSRELTSFISSIDSSIKYISNWYTSNSANPSDIFTSLITQLSNSFESIQSSLLSFSTQFLTNLISSSINVFTTMIFSITISIYMLVDFQGFKNKMKKASSKISGNFPLYLEAIDIQMNKYVRTNLTLMLVYFVEYTFIFFIMGHKGFLIIGILYVFGTLIPYVGGMIVTAIGILTGLTMPRTNLIILIILVMIMSQVDGNFTSPMVYKKGVKVEPLTSLLVIFIGSAIFGAIGVMLSMPVYVAARAVFTVKNDLNEETLLESSGL